MQNQKWRWFVAMLLALSLVAAACGGDDEEPEDEGNGGGGAQTEEFPAGSTMADIQEAGELVVGVKYDVPPFGFKNPQSGEVEGFDVDIGTKIAEALGVEPVFKEAISDNRIPFLQDGTVDLVLSTMTITSDRAVEIDYSRPYFVAHGRILVPEGSDIAGIEDLGGKSVCTAIDSTYETTISDEQPDADLKLVDSYSECYELLQDGAVDAVSTDDVILTGMVIQAQDSDQPLELVGDELTTEPYGAGVPDEDQEFATFVSGVIDETFASGEWDDLYEEWVGQYTGEPADDPQELGLSDAYELFPCDELCKDSKKEEDIQNPPF
jgi:glutamate transport system substrate-binding protein